MSAEAIHKVCEDLHPFCDFVIFDTMTGVDYSGWKLAGEVADKIIIVMDTSFVMINYAPRIIEANGLREGNDIRLVINSLNSNNVRRSKALSVTDVTAKLPFLSLLGVVPDNEHITLSARRGELGALNPGSPASVEFENIARRLLGEEVPFTEMDEI